MNTVLIQLPCISLSSRYIGPDVCCSPSLGIEPCHLGRIMSMKRKAPQNFTILRATRPEVSILEHSVLGTETVSEQERVDGTLFSSRSPQKGRLCMSCADIGSCMRNSSVLMLCMLNAGHSMGASPLSNLEHKAEEPVLTSSLIAQAVNKSLDEVYPSILHPTSKPCIVLANS